MSFPSDSPPLRKASPLRSSRILNPISRCPLYHAFQERQQALPVFFQGRQRGKALAARFGLRVLNTGRLFPSLPLDLPINHLYLWRIQAHYQATYALGGKRQPIAFLVRPRRWGAVYLTEYPRASKQAENPRLKVSICWL